MEGSERERGGGGRAKKSVVWTLYVWQVFRV